MSDVLKKFSEEKNSGNLDTLIKQINELSMSILNGISLFELSGSYKTRQHIKLSDGEIEEFKKQIKDDLIRWVFSLCVAEDILKKHNLWEEYESLSGRVIDKVAQNSKSKKSVEKTTEQEETIVSFPISGTEEKGK